MNAYDSNAAAGIAALLMSFFWIFLFIGVFFIVCQWRIYTKAGKPGWASLIPFYNIIVYLDIIGKPWWWLLLLFIPFLNFIVLIIMTNELSKSFGKGAGFTVGLIFLSVIFYPLLAFGDARYMGPGGNGGIPTNPNPAMI